MLSHDDFEWRYAAAGNLTIHYGERGEGHPLICLHGTGPGADAWSNYRRNAGPLSVSFRTVLVDFPRFGKSEKVLVDQPRLTFLSGVIRDFMDTVGIETAHFLGSSMGAQVALKLAIDSPERVDKLVLVGPAVTGYSLFAPMPTESVRQIAAYYKDDGPSKEKMGRLLRSLAYDPAFVSDEIIEERYQASIDPEIIGINKGAHWARESLEGQFDRCAAPSLLIWGQDDRATTLDMGLLLLRKLPDARLYVFGRCGHWAQSEHADEFNRITVEFLS